MMDMNRSLCTLLLLALFTQIGWAQTISNDWNISEGYSDITHKVDNVIPIDPPDEVFNTVWDYSSLIVLDSVPRSVVPVQYASFGNEFPDANMVVKLETEASYSETFYIINEGVAQILGTYTLSTFMGQTSSQKNQLMDPMTWMEFPFNEGQSYSLDADEFVYFNGNFAFLESYSVETSYVGSGTLVTPTGEFPNCVMIKRMFILDGPPTIHYYFYQDNLNRELAHCTIHVAPSEPYEDIVEFSFSSENPVSSIPAVSNHWNVEIANSTLVLDSENANQLEFGIYEMNGQLIHHWSQYVSTGRNTISLLPFSSNSPKLIILTNRSNGNIQVEKWFR